MVCMDLKTRKVLWEMPGVSQFLTTIEGRIYARSQSGNLVVGDAASGEVLHVLQSKEYYISLADPDEGIVYMARSDGQVVALADVIIPYPEKPIIGR